MQQALAHTRAACVDVRLLTGKTGVQAKLFSLSSASVGWDQCDASGLNPTFRFDEGTCKFLTAKLQGNVAWHGRTRGQGGKLSSSALSSCGGRYAIVCEGSVRGG